MYVYEIDNMILSKNVSRQIFKWYIYSNPLFLDDTFIKTQ